MINILPGKPKPSNLSNPTLLKFITVEPLSKQPSSLVNTINKVIETIPQKPKFKLIKPSVNKSFIFNNINQPSSYSIKRNHSTILSSFRSKANFNYLPFIQENCVSSSAIYDMQHSLFDYRSLYLIKMSTLTDKLSTYKITYKSEYNAIQNKASVIEDKLKQMINKNNKLLLEPEVGSMSNTNSIDGESVKGIIKNNYNILELCFQYIDTLYGCLIKKNQSINSLRRINKNLECGNISNQIVHKLHNEQQSHIEFAKYKDKEQSERMKAENNKTENALLIKVTHLEQENQDLVKLLDMNKEYYVKYNELLEVYNKKENEIKEMVSNYNEQLKIKEINNGLFRNENNELKDKISFINNDFAKLTESNQKLQKKIKVLYQQLEQVSNAFLMKNEELNTYIYQYSVYNGKNIMTATGFDYGHQEAGNNDFLTVQS
jgi:hypothetical protein